MQKKNLIALVGVVALILVVGGLYAAFHKSSTKQASTSSASSDSTTTGSSTTSAINNGVLTTKSSSSTGQYLADVNGKTLYSYNADSAGISNCTGACLANWPAYVDSGATTGLPSNVGAIKRADTGAFQYTYKSKPLYYFASDTQAGQVNGNGTEGFSLVKP